MEQKAAECSSDSLLVERPIDAIALTEGEITLPIDKGAFEAAITSAALVFRKQIPQGDLQVALADRSEQAVQLSAA